MNSNKRFLVGQFDEIHIIFQINIQTHMKYTYIVNDKINNLFLTY